MRRIVARAGFPPNSHDGKALLHILETFPRDELFQISEDELFDIALGILNLQERQRIALFVRSDPFERFVSCLVYVPRDRYDTELRLSFQAILEESFAGTATAFSTHFDEDGAGAAPHHHRAPARRRSRRSIRRARRRSSPRPAAPGPTGWRRR